jgi:hypothetical protein
MKGTFKKPFEKEAAEKLVTCLEEGGLTFETKWEFKSKALPEDDPNNCATALILTSNGKTFFSHRGKIGAVTPKHIPEDKHSVLYEGLAKAGLYTEPNFGLGMILVILHLIVYFSLVLPKYMDIGGNFATFGIVSTVAMYIGLLLIYLGTTQKQSTLVVFGLCAYIPGALPGAPATMLTIALLNSFFQNSLYSNVKPFLPAPEPQPSEVLP